MHTCSATHAVIRWQMTATIPAHSKPISDIAISRIPRAIPRLRRIGSRDSGRTDIWSNVRGGLSIRFCANTGKADGLDFLLLSTRESHNNNDEALVAFLKRLGQDLGFPGWRLGSGPALPRIFPAERDLFRFVIDNERAPRRRRSTRRRLNVGLRSLRRGFTAPHS